MLATISTKMVDPTPTRQFLLVCLMMFVARAYGKALPESESESSSSAADGDNEGEANTAWMAPLIKLGWNSEQLRNKIEYGDVTTFELGTPNYEILNPEDEPEFITADQPQYQELLARLTRGQKEGDNTAGSNGEATDSIATKPEAAVEPESCCDEKIDPSDSVKAIRVFRGARPFQKLVANLS